jgi:hypothetical protein
MLIPFEVGMALSQSFTVRAARLYPSFTGPKKCPLQPHA